MQVSIRIRGHLDPDWQLWFEGLQIAHDPDGTSHLYGTLQDQPALYGVVRKMNHLSLALLSLECNESEATGSIERHAPPCQDPAAVPVTYQPGVAARLNNSMYERRKRHEKDRSGTVRVAGRRY
jgi:hypothetical protein